jgi:hypothetical protein
MMHFAHRHRQRQEKPQICPPTWGLSGPAEDKGRALVTSGTY